MAETDRYDHKKHGRPDRYAVSIRFTESQMRSIEDAFEASQTSGALSISAWIRWAALKVAAEK